MRAWSSRRARRAPGSGSSQRSCSPSRSRSTPRRFRTVTRARQEIAAAVVLPLALLLPVAVALAALFDGAPHDGLIALGFASTEVAAAGLVALAGGNAVLALTVV